MNRLQLALITVFGLGYLRPAPGTFGSFLPIIIALLIVWLSPGNAVESVPVSFVDGTLVVLLITAAGVCLQYGSRAEQHFGNKDAGSIVIDEVAGQSIALLFLPWRSVDATGGWMWNIALAGTAFVAFRFMDIVKPPPARSLQRLPGGHGILVDDLIAGIYAMIATQTAVRFIWPMVFASA